MRIKDENERKFYEIEATNGAWRIRTLQRQYNSSLYERLALSREKDEVIWLESNVITKPQDIVKQPTMFEFLGLEEKVKYVESDLETAIINKLQKFLLELGQMLMYVHYYDRYEKLPEENPAIGILLCKEKDDTPIPIGTIRMVIMKVEEHLLDNYVKVEGWVLFE